MNAASVRVTRSLFGALVALLLLPAAAQGAPAEDLAHAPAAQAAKLPFAKVGPQEISGEAFEAFLAQEMRRKFFHGKVPQGVYAQFQREVGQKMVDRILLLDEAKARGLTADAGEVQQTVTYYESRFANDPRFKDGKEKMMASIVALAEEQSLLKQLEAKTREVPVPGDDEARRYYDKNPDKFTEPEDQNVSLILLAVNPWEGSDAWEETRQDALEIHKQLKAGADFAALAKQHSTDKETAEKGGKMGFIHKGRLSGLAEKALDKIKPGEITDPIQVLEGWAIFRLNDRLPPQLMSYKTEAQKRARGLLQRENSEQAWENLKKELRKKTVITINEGYYLPLAPDNASGTPAGEKKATGK